MRTKDWRKWNNLENQNKLIHAAILDITFDIIHHKTASDNDS